MWGMAQRRFLSAKFTVLNGPDLLTNCQHGRAESVQLVTRFALSRFDHQCAGDGERHSGGMKAVVHQSLGDVVHLQAVVLQRASVEYALVGHPPFSASVENRIGVFKASGDIVGTKNGDAGGFGEPAAAHHGDIGVGDWQDAGAAPRRS